MIVDSYRSVTSAPNNKSPLVLFCVVVRLEVKSESSVHDGVSIYLSGHGHEHGSRRSAPVLNLLVYDDGMAWDSTGGLVE